MDSFVDLNVFNKDRNSKYGGAEKSTPALHPSESLRGVVAGDGLDLEIFFQAVFAPFAAVAGLLVAAERRGAVVRNALQVDVAGAQLAADLAGAFDGVGGDVTGETIRRVVGDLHRVFLILGAEDGEHGAENLFPRDRHVVGDIRKNGRTHVE